MGSWLRRNWSLAFHNGFFLALAVFLVVVTRNEGPIAGAVLAAFLIQRAAVHTLMILIARAMREQTIDLREANRRMSMLFRGQVVVLAVLVTASLFSEIPWLALLPGLALPVRVFVYRRTRKYYHDQPPGEYWQKGRYD